MAYRWIPVTEDFDKTLVIKKWRYDVSYSLGGNIVGALSELPNIDIADCWDNSQPENGYAFSNRFNIGQDYFSNRYYGFTDGFWTATTSSHTTLVDNDIYEFECPVDLYWAGFCYGWDPSYENKMWFYVEDSDIDVDTDEIQASSGSSSYTVSISAETGTLWSASTNDSWITVSPATGDGNSSLTISVSGNTGYTERTGEVVLETENDEITITIVQEKKAKILERHPLYFEDTEIIKMYKNGEVIYQAVTQSSGSPEPEQYCSDSGLCGDYPNCHECTCEEIYDDPADICDCEGKYWYNDTCNDEAEPSDPCDECVSQDDSQECCECAGGTWTEVGPDEWVCISDCQSMGMCGDYPDCYECEPEETCEDQGLCDDMMGGCVPCTDPCEEYEEGSQEECECRGGMWDGETCNEPEPDPCVEDPCSCAEPGSQEECDCQGGTWDGEECQFE